MVQMVRSQGRISRLGQVVMLRGPSGTQHPGGSDGRRAADATYGLAGQGTATAAARSHDTFVTQGGIVRRNPSPPVVSTVGERTEGYGSGGHQHLRRHLVRNLRLAEVLGPYLLVEGPLLGGLGRPIARRVLPQILAGPALLQHVRGRRDGIRIRLGLGRVEEQYSLEGLGHAVAEVEQSPSFGSAASATAATGCGR